MLADFADDLHMPPSSTGQRRKVNLVVILAFSSAGKSCSLTDVVNLKRTFRSVFIHPFLN